MSRKLILLTCAILCLAFTSQLALAATNNYWDDGGGDHAWSTGANWVFDNEPNSNDIANVGATDVGSGNWPVLSSSVSTIHILKIATGCDAELTVNSGTSLSTNARCMIGFENYNGTLTMNGGTIDCGGQLQVGPKTDSNGVIYLNGGTLNVSASCVLPYTVDANAHIFLDGGTLNVQGTNFDMRNGSEMDITTGTLILEGDALGEIRAFEEMGFLTAYGGDGELVYDYDDTNAGKTTVTATVDNAQATDPFPAEYARDVNVSTTLSWTAGSGATSHQIYIGRDRVDVNNADTSSDEYLGSYGSASAGVSNLAYGDEYYWRVDEVAGSTTKGKIWKFTTKLDPNAASDPDPVNLAEGISTSGTTLSWTAGDTATSHDVYFGTDYYEVREADTSSDEFQGNQGGTTYSTGSLTNHQTYYWRVDEKDASNNYKGNVWSFTCSPYTLDYDVNCPDTVYLVEVGDVNGREEVLIGTLQGLIARDKPELFVVSNSDKLWVGDLKQKYGVDVTYVNEVRGSKSVVEWCIDHYSSFIDGYVTYDVDTNNDSLSAAVSMAGVLDSIAVDVDIESYATDAGLTEQMDCTSRDDKWVYDNYWNQMFHEALWVQTDDLVNSWMAGVNRDLSTAVKGLTVWNSSSSETDTMYSAVTDNSPCFGWDDPAASGEGDSVDYHANYNMYQIPSDSARNLSYLTGMSNFEPEIDYKQTVRDKTYSTESNVHYVTFIHTDMDNITTQLNGTAWAMGPDRYGHPRRGDFAMGWEMAPTLMKLAPTVAKWWYQDATENDNFIVPFSGMGYIHPHEFPELDQMTDQLERYMLKSDQTVVWINSDGDNFDSAYSDVAQHYTKIDTFRGAFMSGGPYHEWNGDIRWYNGKPFIGVRDSLWDGYESASSLTSAINSRSTDPTSENGYSAVIVHAWSRDLDDVAYVVDNVDSDVRIVTPEEMVEQIYLNFHPSKATSPSPSDEDTDVSVEPTLSWTSGASDFDVYLDTIYDRIEVAGKSSPAYVSNQASNSYSPSTLEEGTTYYWRIDPCNSYGPQKGDIWEFTTLTDNNAPAPDPMTWASEPNETGDSSISMTATTASDDYFDVEYYFECTAGGGNDSGWQSSATYEDTGLSSGTQYTYRVKARDTSDAQNETAYSTSASATTTQPDTAAPTPDPMTWASEPNATGDTSISMTATTASDDSGVEYYFECTAGGGNDSGWQDSTTYEDTGLSYNTQYTYRVKARDKSSNQNETAYSTTSSATTWTDSTAPTPDPMTWSSKPASTGTSSISMTATTASDVSGVQYYFECTAGGGNDSGWQSSASYEDTGLSENTSYTYRVKARDQSANNNETSWSTSESATTDSSCGAAPMYRDGVVANVSAAHSAANAALPLLPSILALAGWAISRKRK